jgi:hypothetical protein
MNAGRHKPKQVQALRLLQMTWLGPERQMLAGGIMDHDTTSEVIRAYGISIPTLIEVSNRMASAGRLSVFFCAYPGLSPAPGSP